MGMSIENSLEWLISRKEHYEMDDNCQELAQALDVAIDTMHKYQKIKDIVSLNNEEFKQCGLKEILEVIADENND